MENEIRKLFNEAIDLKYDNPVKGIKLLQELLLKLDPKVNEHDWLYVHHTILTESCRITEYKDVPEKIKKEQTEIATTYARKCLDILQPRISAGVIPTDSDLMYLQEEVIRYSTNHLAWGIYEQTSSKAKLEAALELINLGCQYVKDQHFYVYDTKVRILMKLKRKEEAFEVVYKTLLKDSSFYDFKGFKKNKAYLEWKKAIEEAPLANLTPAEEKFLKAMPLEAQKIKANYEDLLQEKFPPNNFTKEVISLAEAKERYPQMKNFYYDGGLVQVLKGDVFIEGNLNEAWQEKHQSADCGLMLIDGNVSIKGVLEDDNHLLLLIVGNLVAVSVYSEDGQIYISGDATIASTLQGVYNDGMITVAGKTKVPFILNSDHHIEVESDAINISNLGNVRSETHFTDKYEDLDCARLLALQVWDKNDEFDVKVFNELLINGQSPFREN